MKKPFKTTFEQELILNMKKLALDLDCDVKDILEVSYNYLLENKSKKEIFQMVLNNKGC